MIKKPLKDRYPNGDIAGKAMKALERTVKVAHLRSDEYRVEGDLFIPRPWRMRGYVLCPNITNQGLLYRGDALDFDINNEIPPKFSTAITNELDVVDRFYRRMRWDDLGIILLRSHPIYRLLSMGIKLPCVEEEYFRISTSTLLHCYGLSSPYISLTADIEIALFYAVTDYDEKTKAFVPTKKKFGILSSYLLNEPFNQTSRVFPIGLQVFERSGLNKEFVCRLGINENYYNLPEVRGLLFYQDRNFSEYMLSKFDNGELLCPKDDILKQKIEQSDGYVLEKTFQRFMRRYPQYKMELESVKEKYRVTDEVRDLYRFSQEELERQCESPGYWWYEFCNKIYFEADTKLDRSFFENIPYDSYYSKYFNLWL